MVNSAKFVVLLLALTFAVVNGKPNPNEATPEKEGEKSKEERQFDFDRDNYDPYEAQASAVAFRRFKEAQALKEGHFSNRYGVAANANEDLYPSAVGAGVSDPENGYEKKFYDPFFYFNGQTNNPRSPNSVSRRNGRIAQYQSPVYSVAMLNGVPVRTRRNTGTTVSTISDGIDNNLLNEDVYFFRRDPTTEARNKQRISEFEKSPYYFRESAQMPEERQFPVSRTVNKEYFNNRPAAGPMGRQHDGPFFSRLEQSPRYNTNFGGQRAYYQQYQPQQPQFGLGQSQLDHNALDGPRIRDYSQSMPRTLAAGLPGVNGWAVQVGTQLRVHDDGRTRHPHRYYVKDEKPRQIGRYPNYSNRQ